ncbi:MAG: amidohydrolase family protein [Bdellovibrionaceae bacterium]|nr:amidohydrolase family protein [Pseudobdellovibrionaceae bacterium]
MVLKSFFFVAGALLITGCVSSASKKTDSVKILQRLELDADESLPVIDVHTHTRFSGKPEITSKIPDTFEQYLKEMKEAGVVGAVSHVGSGRQGFNAELSKHHVIQCFGIGDQVDVSAVEKGLRSKDFRCIKIYLGYVHRFAHDKAYRPLYRLAEKYDVPVVFHTGDTYSATAKLKYSDPLTIDEVAVDFPKVTFVIAHLGNPWTQVAAEVAYKNPNVYIEASALLIGDLAQISEAGLERYLVEPIRWAFGYMEDPSKFMYGTDWPLTGMKNYLEAYKKAIPREHWCEVFFENAVKVFRMKDLEGQYKCRINAEK